jgi:catechol 2,3-dioxygenase-like lactoylglutathione lyase family enzyme
MKTNLLPARPHHVAYLVDDLELAASNTAEVLGAGPFFVLRDIPLDATSHGAAVDFNHSAAFGQWGPLFMELMQVDHTSTAELTSAFGASGPVLGHVAWAVPDLDVTSAEVEQAGLPLLMWARAGDIEFAMHDARDKLGYLLEIHVESPGFLGFFEQVHQASIDWDGTNPLREPDQGGEPQ